MQTGSKVCVVRVEGVSSDSAEYHLLAPSIHCAPAPSVVFLHRHCGVEGIRNSARQVRCFLVSRIPANPLRTWGTFGPKRIWTKRSSAPGTAIGNRVPEFPDKHTSSMRVKRLYRLGGCDEANRYAGIGKWKGHKLIGADSWLLGSLMVPPNHYWTLFGERCKNATTAHSSSGSCQLGQSWTWKRIVFQSHVLLVLLCHPSCIVGRQTNTRAALSLASTVDNVHMYCQYLPDPSSSRIGD